VNEKEQLEKGLEKEERKNFPKVFLKTGFSLVCFQFAFKVTNGAITFTTRVRSRVSQVLAFVEMFKFRLETNLGIGFVRTFPQSVFTAVGSSVAETSGGTKNHSKKQMPRKI
jgi:hypothetical protein